jgi:uncharacterized protein YecT (DUF1311 family)
MAALGVSMALWTMSAQAAGPSFDCSKAGNWAEKTICQNDELAALDAWFTPLYGQVLARVGKDEAESLRARRKTWLASRRECEANGVDCLEAIYREFIGQLEWRLSAGASDVDWSKAGRAPASPLSECTGQADVQECLERLLESDEAVLNASEETAHESAVAADQAMQTTHAADRLAEANVAWRSYRNAECKRRQEGVASDVDGQAAYSACLVELTRTRIQELQ